MKDSLRKKLSQLQTKLPSKEENENLFTATEYAAEAGISFSTAKHHLKRLVDAGKLRRVRMITLTTDGKRAPVLGYEYVE